jgi:hypothetical protein
LKKKSVKREVSERIDKLVGIKKPVREVSEKIDKLTNSIVNVISGDILDTEFYRMKEANKVEIKKKDWLFDWHEEIKYNDREVYKLTIKDNSDIIQGLISLGKEPDHIFIHIVENAKFNRGKDKVYLGVLGNMFAFACKKSKEMGYKGYVGFVAKTKLVEHYKKTVGAQSITTQRMAINEAAANKLINQYFKS